MRIEGVTDDAESSQTIEWRPTQVVYRSTHAGIRQYGLEIENNSEKINNGIKLINMMIRRLRYLSLIHI